jgi:uncharacterized protein with FMN-binding domain
MKTSRVVGVVGLSGAVVAAGWAAGTGFLTPPDSAAAAGLGATTTQSTQTDTGSQQSSGVTTSKSGTASGATSGTDNSASGSATGTDTSGSSSAPASTTSTFDGDAVSTRYGTFQAEITVTDGTVTDITLLQDGAYDRHSQEINNYAIPRLTKEVLSAQSANVQGISGASFTSGGFLETVASAFQAAGLS